jgi:hypothetical protein
MKNTKLVTIGICLLFISNMFSQATLTYGSLTDDGAWCWFSDPRAIYSDGHIITGWVKKDGTIEAASFNPSTEAIMTDILYDKLEFDDHNNPAFVETKEGDILAFYTKHSKQHLYFNRSKKGLFDFGKAVQIDPVDSIELQKFPRKTITYANPYSLEKEKGRIYCFGRWTGFKPNVMWSDNSGDTWTKSKVFITNYPFKSNNRPYVKYYSDGVSKIHFIFTDGHPRDEPTNSVYYAYYEKGAFYKADGSRICTLEEAPFEPKQASVIYRSNEEQGRAWISDLGQDKRGNPVILYTRSPEETDHRYYYANYVDGQWENHEICKSGKWFPQTQEGKKEREPHYFGGMTLHPDNANVIYLSREIDGVFEIERRETNNGGKDWKIEAITKESTLDNVRPYMARGLTTKDKEVVMWMENNIYIHYKNYDTSIKYVIRGVRDCF